MMATSSWRCRRWALLFMLLGSSSVFLIILFLNQLSEKVEKQTHARPMTFEVKRELSKPKPVPQKPKPKTAKAKPPQVSAALLSSELSGLDFGLSGFSASDIGQIDSDLLGNMKDVVMTSDMVDVAPRPRQRMAVEYPARAKAKDIEGYVVLSILINKSGRVETVKVLEAEPVGVFEKPAINTVKKWLFEPARYKGEKVESWANQTIRFELG